MTLPGPFPDGVHGTTRGKLYAFMDDGLCNECLVEAWERQTYGGLGAGFARSTLLGSLAFDEPAHTTLATVVDGGFRHRTVDWIVPVRVRGE